MKNYIQYWSQKNADEILNKKGLLDHTFSKRFRLENVNDTVWVVAIDTHNNLNLLGKIEINCFLNKIAAYQLYRDEIFREKNCVSTEHPMLVENIRITHIANELTKFNGNKIFQNTISHMKIQGLPEIDDKSANLLQKNLSKL